MSPSAWVLLVGIINLVLGSFLLALGAAVKIGGMAQGKGNDDVSVRMGVWCAALGLLFIACGVTNLVTAWRL